MDTFNCAHCGQPHRGQVAPPACQRCGQPMSSSSGMGELSLDLKEMVACNRCGHEAYEEAFAGGVCPRCHEQQEEDEGDEEEAPSARSGPRRRVGGRPGRPGRPGKKGRAAPTPPPEKRKVILTEEFKAQVFGAIRLADARTAQQLCFELVGENEAHAKQIYEHLLGIAKKKGWVGIDVGRAPAPAGRSSAAGPAYAAPPPGPPPGQPLDPLPLPPGILGGEPPPGQPLDPLPLPAGILGGPGEVAPAPYPAAAPQAAPPPYGAAPPPYPAPAAEAAPPPAAPQPAPAATGTARRGAVDDEEPDPEERGFFNRVAVAGRAAQASLLCLAGRFAAAKDLAESTLARDPGAARGLAALGEAQVGLGEEQAALQTYASAVRADPADPVVIRGYAQLLMRLGRLQEAIGAYQRIVGPGKGELRDAVALAAALRKVGNVQGAQRVIEEVVKRDPQSLEPVRQEAEAKAARGDLDGAARLLDQLLGKERAPYPLASALAESIVGRTGASVLARLACAKVFVATGRPFQAVRLLGPVLSGGAPPPLLLEARRRLGLAYAALGAGAQAEEHLLAVVQQGAGGAEELRALGVIYLERGDTDKGVRALMRARDAAPDDAPTRRELARALAAAGDLEGAIRELTAAHERAAGSDDQALEDELDRITERAFAKRVKELETRLLADEQDVEARLELARAHGQRGDLPAAIEQLEWVQGRDPGAAAKVIAAAEQVREEGEATADRALTLLLARLHAEAGAHERAIEVLEEYLAAEPEDPEGRLALLDHYARGQRVQDAAVGLRAYLEDANPFALERAVAIAERLLAEHQGHAALVLSVARSRRRLGDTEAAVGHLRRYVEAAPDDTEARVELARLLEAAGRRGEAYDVLKVLVEGGAGSTAELERLASLALGAGRVDDAVAHLRRAVERHPEDLALKHALEATEARARRARLEALEGSQRPEDRLELAGLLIEEGKTEQATGLLRALGRLEGSDPELATLRFSAEWFARRGKGARAEAALRAVGRHLGYAPGADAHKDLLARIGAMYERAGERAAARRVYLEIYSQDPQYRDVAARLENLSEDVRAAVAGADERVLELVELGAPLVSVLETLQSLDLAIDPRVLAGSRTSASLQAAAP